MFAVNILEEIDSVFTGQYSRVTGHYCMCMLPGTNHADDTWN